MIGKLNPKITGITNYFRYVSSKVVFSKLDRNLLATEEVGNFQAPQQVIEMDSGTIFGIMTESMVDIWNKR